MRATGVAAMLTLGFLAMYGAGETYDDKVYGGKYEVIATDTSEVKYRAFVKAKAQDEEDKLWNVLTVDLGLTIWKDSQSYLDSLTQLDIQSSTPVVTTLPVLPGVTKPSEPKIEVKVYEQQYPTSDQWYRLRMCESTDNPRAISPQGWYRGLYQFDFSTWQSVGGTGDPIDASRDEQHYRAQLLYNSRGPSPWPVCGRYLR